MNTILKKTVALILVSVFLFQTFSKVVVYADYLINKDYITKVLCINKDKPKMHCNGKCHLKKQLEKEKKKEQSPANPVKEKREIQFFSEFNFNISEISPPVTKILAPDYYFSLSEKHLTSVFQPPKA